MTAALAPAALRAQRAGTAPPEARVLVARVDSRFGEDEADVGAAVVVGLDERWLYLATARHVVRKADTATAVRLTFAAPHADTATAAVLPLHDPRLDLAVLRVPRPREAHLAAVRESLDRLGDVRGLTGGDPVQPVGCPQGDCWNVPVPADQVVGVDRGGVIFQSAFVSPGSSGGALFDRLWEVVGLVVDDAPPRANALAMDAVLDRLRAWRVPVQLRRRAIPRAGYRTVVSAALLAPTDALDAAGGVAGRLPSGRLALHRRTRGAVTLHASAMRLAPRDVAVTAGMIGAGLPLARGRVALTPFAEAGLGSVETRADGGGYTLAGVGGAPGTYVPRWIQLRADGLGVGGGVDAQVVLAPHLLLGVLAGSWRFSMPQAPVAAGLVAPRVPTMPNFYLGVGLRWGL